MMDKLERIGLGLLLAPVAPLVGLLAGWWGGYTWLPERWIPVAALAGLLLGVAVDAAFLRRWVDAAYRLDPKLWIAIYLFYSMGTFGFFMGVPLFNAVLAVPAGFVVGGRLARRGADDLQLRTAARTTALFTTGVLALICAASAFLALASPSTASDLKGLLGLPFEVTPGMILTLILGGGAALLAVGWGLAVASVRFSFALLKRKA